ncbi:metal transporter [Sulfurovum lithotrophicum]|uniref:Metal transporter n=1 Tax=Sulfurovum lithotrophicum TaxID=206403 RepID=A0A7U4M1B9_9BACT|nr:ion channel [Sulfurovum lithotrophicum]AKF25051.1 metal transporter [Sulfurovum lithotrophicum]
MLAKFLQREKRFIKSERVAFLVLPIVLIPLMFEVFLHGRYTLWFDMYKDEILISNILYIVLARFAVLDAAVYIFSRSKNHVHLALIQIVLLYLEVTIITIVFYAVLFNMFDVFSLFHLNSQFPPENLKMIQEHSFVTSMYISTVTFTTLGSGDWIPQTLPAMVAVISEVILGVVQGGVFVAIVIYAHQNKGNL